MEVPTEKWTALYPLRQCHKPLPFSEAFSGDSKGQHPPCFNFSLFFPSFGRQALKTRKLKSSYIYGGVRESLTIPREKQRFRKKKKKPKKTLPIYLQLSPSKEMVSNSQQAKQKQKNTKLWGKGKSDFQGYHITRFKCSILNNSNNNNK